MTQCDFIVRSFIVIKGEVGKYLFLLVLLYSPLAHSNICQRKPSVCNGGGESSAADRALNLLSQSETYVEELKKNIKRLQEEVSELKKKWELSVSALKATHKELQQCKAGPR